MIMSGVALLRETSAPTEADIISSLKPNICRCGAYPRIVTAVSRAAEMMKSERKEGAA
jgi:aerobic-type carbon monoxide dehydrogenase small subunit (CoxS/CutS family)